MFLYVKPHIGCGHVNAVAMDGVLFVRPLIGYVNEVAMVGVFVCQTTDWVWLFQRTVGELQKVFLYVRPLPR